MGSSGGGDTTSTVYQTSLPSYAQPYYEAMLDRAMVESTQPYVPYPDERIAEAPADLERAYEMTDAWADSNDIYNETIAAQQRAANWASYYGGEAFKSGDQSAAYGAGALDYAQAGANEAANYANELYNRAGTYGAQAQNYGQAGYNYGAAAAGYAPQFQAYGNQAAALAPQAAQYGNAAYISGQHAQNIGDLGLTLMDEARGYGAQGAGYGMDAASLGRQAFDYGNRAATYGDIAAGETYSPSDISPFMSPYMDEVVRAQQEDVYEQFDRQAAERDADAVAAGAFGNNRRGVTEAIATEDMNEQLALIQAEGQQRAYESATQQAQFANEARQKALAAGMSGQQIGMSAVEQALAGQQTAISGAQTGIQGTETGYGGLQAGISGAQAAMQGAQAGMQGIDTGLAAYQTGMQGLQGATAAQQAGMQGAELGLAGTEQGLSSVNAGIAAGQYGLQGRQFGMTGYDQAMAGEAQRMQAQQIGIEAELARMQGYRDMGVSQQMMDALTMNQINAMFGIGQNQQLLEQAKLDMAYNDYVNQRDAERQNLMFLSSLLQGVPISANQDVLTSTSTNPAAMAGTTLGLMSLFPTTTTQ